MNRKQNIGSYTAKGGFSNESDIVLKFRNYLNDSEAQLWLSIMGYDFTKIQRVLAHHIPPRINKTTASGLGVPMINYEESMTFKKADIQIKIEIIINGTSFIENISLKKSNSTAGYNQVDKRSVDKYKKLWGIPDTVVYTLKLYTGELPPEKVYFLKDSRRMYLHEISDNKVEELIEFFNKNKVLIFNDVLRGRGALSAEWMLVTRNNSGVIDWVLKDINFVCNYFSSGNVEITKKGNLKVGRMIIQRKGGTPDPTSLQFKINPLELFDAF
jgi:hypothetical protein